MKQEIKDILRERRESAELVARKNLAYALSFPEFKKLYEEEREVMIELARALALDSSGAKDLKKKHSSLLEVEEAYLKTKELSLSDLKPKYFCSKCDDTGIFNGRECDCARKLKNDYLLKQSGFSRAPRAFEESNFSIFDDPKYFTSLYEKMKDWTQKRSSKIKNIVLCGNTGTGKTFLLECMLTELIKNGRLTLYTTAFNLGQTFLKYHVAPEDKKQSVLENVLSCEVLIIDDLGSEPMLRNVTEEYLYLTLNERLTSGLSTIISTNLTPDELKDRYGERVFSRLINKNQNLLLKFENRDLRLKP